MPENVKAFLQSQTIALEVQDTVCVCKCGVCLCVLQCVCAVCVYVCVRVVCV